MMDTQPIECRIIQKLLRKQAAGSKSFQKTTVSAWFPSSEADQVENILENLVEAPDSPIIMDTENEISLESVDSAKSYLEENDCGTSLWADLEITTSDESPPGQKNL